MGPKAQELLEAILELPENERVELLAVLIESFEPARANEFKRRIEQMDSPALETIDWEKARQTLRRIREGGGQS